MVSELEGLLLHETGDDGQNEEANHGDDEGIPNSGQQWWVLVVCLRGV